MIPEMRSNTSDCIPIPLPPAALAKVWIGSDGAPMVIRGLPGASDMVACPIQREAITEGRYVLLTD